jgi:hypothetical protein
LQPLEEVFSTNLAIAIKNSDAPQDAGDHGGFSQSQDVSVENRLKPVCHILQKLLSCTMWLIILLYSPTVTS